MKHLVLLIYFFSLFVSSAQIDNFHIGAEWTYSNSFVRDSFYWDSKYSRPMDSIYPVEIHDIIYSEGLAKVTYNEQVGFIDSSKMIVIPLIYQSNNKANQFINSKSVVIKDDKWGVIDTSGATAFSFIYDVIKRFDDLYYVAIEYDWGYLDSTGHMILPLREYNSSYILTKTEIMELASRHQKKETLENSVPISKDQAISIAKQKQYYYDHSGVFKPSIELNSVSNEWIIKSTERKGTTRKGRCAKTNGCIVQVKYNIVINSNTGKVKQKTKQNILIPIYE